jgi:hypothetical protein
MMINASAHGRHFGWDDEDVSALKDKGFDGIITTAHGSSPICTVFDPEQIGDRQCGQVR